MGKLFGHFVKVNSDGSVTTCKVQTFETYAQLVSADPSIQYAIVLENNIVYHKNGNEWVVHLGFGQR